MGRIDLSTPCLPPPSRRNTPPRLNLSGIRDGIATRRRRLLDLEAAMTAACEAEAMRGRAAGVHRHDRGTWDRAAWSRYLAAAASAEHHYGPPMRRLQREIDRPERVLALPLAPRAA